MNKLTKALLVSQALGWTKNFAPEVVEGFVFLLEETKNLKDEELIESELILVDFINQVLDNVNKEPSLHDKDRMDN